LAHEVERRVSVVARLARLGLGSLVGVLVPCPSVAAAQESSPSLPPQDSSGTNIPGKPEAVQKPRHAELVYLNGEAGFTNVSIGSHFFVPGQTSDQSGGTFGVGAGLRFLAWTIGLQARVAPLSSFTFMEANVEAGFQLRLAAWEPHVGIHGGYARAAMNRSGQYLAGMAPSASTFIPYTPASPEGQDVGGSVGTDYYVSPLFSLGADVSLDALFLKSNNTTVDLTFGGMPASLVLGGAHDTGVAFVAAFHGRFHF
jgi:hypothetical protein